MSFFDNINWDNIINGFAQYVPAMVTGYIGQSGVADANTRAAQIAEANRQENLKATAAARTQAAGYLQPIADQAMPAGDYLRTVMARSPYELTPQQQIEQADRTRIAQRSMPAAFRGSGRATSAVLNDVVNRGRAGMIEQNQRRADTAASTLAGTGTNARSNMANIAVGGGRDTATINTGAATDQANAITNTAAAGAKTLGDITSYFANANKDSERESRYGKAKATLEGT